MENKKKVTLNLEALISYVLHIKHLGVMHKHGFKKRSKPLHLVVMHMCLRLLWTNLPIISYILSVSQGKEQLSAMIFKLSGSI